MSQQGHYQEAIGLFKEGIDSARMFSPMILCELGYAEFKLGHFPQAQYYFNFVQHLDPRYSTVYRYWGEFYDVQGDLGKAKESYYKALSLSPRDREYLKLLLDVHERQQNLEPLH